MDPGTLSLLAVGGDFAERAGRLISDAPWLAPLAIFAGGVLTAANPCVLATIPLLMAYVSGREDVRSFRRAVVMSLVFVAGLSIAFAALGVVAALAGTLLGDLGTFWDYAILVVCLLMGAHLVGLLEVPLPSVNVAPKWRGLPGAFLLGGLFGLVSTPCATPILVVVLTYIAGTGASVPYGALLLVFYALGHSVLILAAGASAGLARGLVASKGLAVTGRVLRIAAGILIAAVGVWLFMGRA
ncbi:MAG: cytochrome c biogenesis CcdA family protein [Planctomycetes bacterium]|nr:cytochrome c biogenesis CcdA family protein [Planctomycetota bacterium]